MEFFNENGIDFTLTIYFAHHDGCWFSPFDVSDELSAKGVDGVIRLWGHHGMGGFSHGAAVGQTPGVAEREVL